MAVVVVDTDVVSFTFKQDTRARRFRRHLIGNELVVSFMTLAELDQWAMRRKWGLPTRERLDRHLRSYGVHYADRDLCRLWAEVIEQTRSQGRSVQVADAWIAATALALGSPLITHNAADFQGVAGLTIIPEAGP